MATGSVPGRVGWVGWVGVGGGAGEVEAGAVPRRAVERARGRRGDERGAQTVAAEADVGGDRIGDRRRGSPRLPDGDTDVMPPLTIVATFTHPRRRRRASRTADRRGPCAAGGHHANRRPRRSSRSRPAPPRPTAEQLAGVRLGDVQVRAARATSPTPLAEIGAVGQRHDRRAVGLRVQHAGR